MDIKNHIVISSNIGLEKFMFSIVEQAFYGSDGDLKEKLFDALRNVVISSSEINNFHNNEIFLSDIKKINNY